MARIARQDASLLPQDSDAERAVLGALLIDPDAMLSVRQGDLAPTDFYQESNGLIYAAMLELADRYQPVDLVTLSAALESKQNGHGSELALIGGSAYLVALIEATPTSIHAAHYAGVVRSLAQRRRIIAAAGDIAAQAQAHEGTTDELYNTVTATFLRGLGVQSQRSHLYGTDETLLAYIANQHARAERYHADPNALMTTGIADLDRILGNLEPATICAIAARPGVGKTVLAEQIAEHNAKHGKHVAFYHLELSHQFMLDRRMARYSAVSLDDLKRNENLHRVAQATDAIREWHGGLVYIDCSGWAAERIAADIRRLVARRECDLAIVDYLQLMPLPFGRGSMNAAMLIGLQALALKDAATQLGIPIVLVSQLRRGERERADKRPTLEDFRNSGEIEEKVNQAILIHRPNERPEGAESEVIECHVAKNTGGDTGRCELVHVVGRYMLAGKARQGAANEIDF